MSESESSSKRNNLGVSHRVAMFLNFLVTFPLAYYIFIAYLFITRSGTRGGGLNIGIYNPSTKVFLSLGCLALLWLYYNVYYVALEQKSKQMWLSLAGIPIVAGLNMVLVRLLEQS